mgnify:CR=1 FL=1
MTFNLDPNKPIYQQVAQQILQDIKEGKLRPGDRLPTERELAAQLGVARGTVKKAYRELADNNLVEVIQGSGTYVHSHRQGSWPWPFWRRPPTGWTCGAFRRRRA